MVSVSWGGVAIVQIMKADMERDGRDGAHVGMY
jgi:hypothetical protein